MGQKLEGSCFAFTHSYCLKHNLKTCYSYFLRYCFDLFSSRAECLLTKCQFDLEN